MPILASSTTSSDHAPSEHPVAQVNWGEVFRSPGVPKEEPYLTLDEWASPVTYFVGRNGTGKSRTARALARNTGGRLLPTDRLFAITGFQGGGIANMPADYRGIPIGESEASTIRSWALQPNNKGALEAIENLYLLREQPDVLLRVAAFVRRALGRSVELRERSGYLDPHVRLEGVEYSLFREEGHGLRELVILLTATYRNDWKVLVIDEPELHLHPAMARLWVTELEQECRRTDRHAVVITHEPSLLKPKSVDDLASLWLFQPGIAPKRFYDNILEIQRERISASLIQYPDIISHIAFSPRPVLVEGPHDVAALTTALRRTQPPEVAAQTDIVACGGSGTVALWFEVCTKLGLDVRAVADLDACLAPEVTRTMDSLKKVTDLYASELAAEPARTGTVLRPLIAAMDRDEIAKDPKSRAAWLAVKPWSSGDQVRKDKLIDIWRTAGMWLHPQGTLEDVLNISTKGVMEAQAAAATAGPLDQVAAWCAYRLDPSGDVFALLGLMVERIAHEVIEALRLSPDARFSRLIGPTSESDSRLVDIEPTGEGRHKLTVRAPAEFAGYWVEFSRDTPSRDIVLAVPPPA